MRLAPAIFAGLFMLLNIDARAGLYFWDANGTNVGAGGPTPTGTWGVDAYWSKDDMNGNTGTNTPGAWDPGADAVFSAGNDATGTFVVKVSGIQQVADIHVDLGNVTLNPFALGASLLLNDVNGSGSNRLLSVGGKDPNATATYNVPLTGATNVFRYKQGTLILGATNVYAGPTVIQGGVLQLAVSNAIPTNSQLVLSNNDNSHGDFDPSWALVPPVFNTGGLSQRLGTLLLSGSNTVSRIIDFGNGASALVFADSHAQNWGGLILTLTNYTSGADSLRIGTTSSGLTATQLGEIQFADFGNVPGKISSTGFVTPALPVITGIIRTNISGQLSFTINWTGLTNRTYRVQSTDNLDPSAWADLSLDIPGTAPTFTDVAPGTSPRYYRVVLEFP